MDITELRSHAFEYAREGMVITDPHQPDNPIIDVNAAFEVLTGYERDEVTGKNCRFLQGKYTDQPTLNTIREAIAGHHHCRVTLKNVRKDGTEFWNELSVSPIFDSEGELLAYIGIQRDATTRLTLEKRYKDEHEQLKQAHAALQIQMNQRKSLDDRINDVIEQAIRYTS